MSRASGLNILMFAFGSGGDVYPHIAIGKALRSRGHRVLIVSNPHFESVATQAGLEFLGSGTVEEARETIENPDLWKRGKGFELLFDSMLKSMPATYDIIARRNEPGRTVVVGGSLALGARVAQEKLGVPVATVHLQPILLRSLNEQPGVNVPGYLKPLVPPLRRVLLHALDNWVFDPVILPRLNSFRREVGLAPVRRVLREWIHSPQMVIGLFPDWFSAPQPDWPRNTHLTGFTIAEQAETSALPADAARFLEEGDPPIVFTLGTAMLFARKFFEVSAETCRILGRRGILLTQFPEQLPERLPPQVRHFPYLPFSQLLPRAAALVHHGGIGTVSQALAAGIPQLITPFNFDQPDNAARVSRLETGHAIRPRAYVPQNVSRRLKTLLTSPQVAANCRSAAARCHGQESFAETCRLIESLATSSIKSAAAP